MADPVTPETPPVEPAVAPGDELYEAVYDDTVTALPSADHPDGTPLTPAEPETPAVAPAPEADAEVEKPATNVHSAATIAKAVMLDIPPEEIEACSPDELRRLVMVVSNIKRSIPAPAAAPAVVGATEEDVLAGIDEAFDPALVKILRTQEARLKAAQTELAELKAGDLQARSLETGRRIDGLLNDIAPGLADTFNAAKREGKERREELMGLMTTLIAAERSSGKLLDEKVRLQRALLSLDFMPKTDEVAAKKTATLEAEKERFAKGGLGKPVSRTIPKTAVGIVDEILQRQRKERKPADRTVWAD